MAIRSGKERWVADCVALSSRQKDGSWIFHRVTARVTSAAHAGGQPARTARRRDRRAGCPTVDWRAGRGGDAGTPGPAKAVVTGRPTVRTVWSSAWSLPGY